MHTMLFNFCRCIVYSYIIEYGSYSIVGIDQVSYGFPQKCALK